MGRVGRVLMAVLAGGLLALPGGAVPAGAHDGADGHTLVVSGRPDRSGAVALDGASLRGPAYVVLTASPDARSVSFHLDDPDRQRTPRQVERFAPYDFAGGSTATANAFDTTTVADGTHTVTAVLVAADGTQHVAAATFTVANAAPPPPPTAAEAARVNAGGARQQVGDAVWSDCRSGCPVVRGGFPYAPSTAPSISGVAVPANAALYQTEWTGGAVGPSGTVVPVGSTAFTFDVPVPPGSYRVRLHFAEVVQNGPGKRVFDVNVEGGPAELLGFDVYAQAGGMNRAIVREFPVEVRDGAVTVEFLRRVENAKVSAIEVLPAESAPGPSGNGAPPPQPPPSTPFAWDVRAASPVGRTEANGAVVNGRLYLLGGFTSSLKAMARSDVYDPASNTWSGRAAMPEPLTHAPAVVDGTTIWLLGGYLGDHPGGATAHVWKYDTARNTWSRGPDLPAPRGAGGAAIAGRTLHFFGGTNRPSGTIHDTDQADHWTLPLDGGTSWTRRAPLPNPRNHLAGVGLHGKVYAVGGQHGHDEHSGNQASVHVFDPAAGAWSALPDLPVARSHITASALVRDGRLVVLGGTENGNVASDDVFSFDPQARQWVRLPSLPAGRKTPVAGLVGDAILVATGSGSSTTWSGSPGGRWEVGPGMPVALGEVAGGIVGGSLYLVGEGSAATLAHDLATGAWRSGLAQRPYIGHHHAAEVVADRLYLLGGLGSGAGRVQVYDPALNRWTLAPSMPFAAGSSASAVIGGRVYVAGGIVGSSTTTQAAVFDPQKGTWQAIAPMPQGRNHAAASTDGARLYVFGGRGPGSGDANTVANGFDTVQVYDPSTNRWASSADPASGIAPLPQARGGTGKAVYADGEFFVMGGETSTGAGATSAGVYHRVDVYDPVANRWRLAAPLPTARHGIFPVLLAGRVAVAGGGVRAGHSASPVLETYTLPAQ